MPAVQPPPGVSLPAYARDLEARYANPAIRHRTWQIAMDGSQKLPQRILGTLAENVIAGRSSPGLLLAVAAWMRYVGGVDETGVTIDVRDPLASRLRSISNAVQTPAEKVTALLAIPEIFPPALAATLCIPLIAASERLWSLGARAAVAELSQSIGETKR
jgi:fructuronate reductase